MIEPWIVFLTVLVGITCLSPAESCDPVEPSGDRFTWSNLLRPAPISSGPITVMTAFYGYGFMMIAYETHPSEQLD